MRKPTNILFYFGVTLSLLTGCNQENSVVPPLSGEENVEVCLNASVSTIETTITRSGIITGTTLEERAPVGVFGLTEEPGISERRAEWCIDHSRWLHSQLPSGTG